MSAKYVYCILNCQDMIAPDKTGFEERELYNISYKDISALVSDISTVDYSNDNILIHETVNESMMRYYTVLPMRFGTVMSGDAKVRSMLELWYDDFTENFSRLEGQVEMGVKIIWPVDKIKQDTDFGVNIQEQDIDGLPAGVGYLRRRLREHLIEEALKKKANQLSRDVDRLLRPCFADSRVKTMATEKMVLNGSYMVFKDQVEAFRRKSREIILRCPETKILLSGPWPPYNFTRLRQNKTEEGVK